MFQKWRTDRKNNLKGILDGDECGFVWVVLVAKTCDNAMDKFSAAYKTGLRERLR